jgi:hypothetical protein
LFLFLLWVLGFGFGIALGLGAVLGAACFLLLASCFHSLVMSYELFAVPRFA